MELHEQLITWITALALIVGLTWTWQYSSTPPPALPNTTARPIPGGRR